MRIVLAIALLAAIPAAAQDLPPLVTDPDTMCPAISRGEDVREMGMVLTSAEMREIEYYCEFQPPLDIHWRGDTTIAQLAVCSEPGFLSPALFAIRMSSTEPGVVRVWGQNDEQPLVFTACPGQ